MILSFDFKFIRLDQEQVGLARQVLPFLRCSVWDQDYNHFFSLKLMTNEISVALLYMNKNYENLSKRTHVECTLLIGS